MFRGIVNWDCRIAECCDASVWYNTPVSDVNTHHYEQFVSLAGPFGACLVENASGWRNWGDKTSVRATPLP